METVVLLKAILAMLGTILAVLVGFIVLDRVSEKGSTRRLFDRLGLVPPPPSATKTLPFKTSNKSILSMLAQTIKTSFTVKLFIAFTVFMIVLSVAFLVYWWLYLKEPIVLPYDPEDPGPDFVYPEDDSLEQDEEQEMRRIILLPIITIFVVFVGILMAAKTFGWAERKGLFKFVSREQDLYQGHSEVKVEETVQPKTDEARQTCEYVKEFLETVRKNMSEDEKQMYYSFDTLSPAQLSFDFKTGSPYDKDYTQGEEIGRGSFGKVYRCTPKPGKEDLLAEVAIKEIDLTIPSLAKNKSAIASMIQEAALLHHFSSLDPTHFVKIVSAYQEIGTDSDGNAKTTKIYIVMEILHGKGLDAILKAVKIGKDAILVITREILTAVKLMHEHGWRHRDIKPANVFITNNGQVKLIDLGLAGPVGDGKKYGSPHYMSVESLNMVDVATAQGLFAAFPTTLTDDQKSAIMAFFRKYEAIDITSVGITVMTMNEGNFPEVKDLVKCMRQVYPWYRPTAGSILELPLFKEYEDKKLSLENGLVPTVVPEVDLSV